MLTREGMADSRERWDFRRLIPAAVLLLAIAAAFYFFYFTPQGQRMRDTQAVREWIAGRPATAPAVWLRKRRRFIGRGATRRQHRNDDR